MAVSSVPELQLLHRLPELSAKSSPLSPGVNRANGDLIQARHLQSRGRDAVRSELGSSIP
jgi:hypothetical protein